MKRKTPHYRLRTLLQSIDTARYHDDESNDRRVDIAHARSEILSSLLLGYEIVLPAGTIADCPALIELIPEVLNGSDEFRDKMLKHSGSRYSLFRIGLEPKYKKEKDFDNKSYYSAFVYDYINNKLGGPQQYVNLVELARGAKWNPKLVAATLGQAYLERKWGDIENLGNEIARDTGDDNARENLYSYSQYARTVWESLESRKEYLPYVYSERNSFSKASLSLYARGLDKIATDAARLETSFEDLRIVKDQIRKAEGYILESKHQPNERGSWYEQRKVFKEIDSWEFIRNWLDYLLYDRISKAFSVNVPSYFTQEINPDENSAKLSLAHISERSIINTVSDIRNKKQPLPPALHHVDWLHFWREVSEPKYQDSINKLHYACRQALDLEIETLEDISKSKNNKDKKIELIQKAVEIRRTTTSQAIKKHLDFINDLDNSIVFSYDNGKILVDIKKSKISKKSKASVIEFAASLLITAAATPLAPEGLLPAIGVFLASASYLSMFKKYGIPGLVDAVSRPAIIEGKYSHEKFTNAELGRVNYWVSS